jgi:hypothetical protein
MWGKTIDWLGLRPLPPRATWIVTRDLPEQTGSSGPITALEYELQVWRQGWEDSYIAAGMTREQAVKWTDEHYRTALYVSRKK